jgi:hypothetical protein
MVYNTCSLSLDAKQLAFSARAKLQKVVVQGLTGRRPVGLFLCGPWSLFLS